MTVVGQIRDASGLTQAELAEIGGTSQPAIAAYESGAKVPSLRTIHRLARAVGFDVEMRVVPSLTREDRRSLAVHRRIATRLRQDPVAVIAKARVNIDKMRRLHPGAVELLEEWEQALDLPIDELVDLIVDARPKGREMRQVTPFAGVLTAQERVEVVRQFRKAEAGR